MNDKINVPENATFIWCAYNSFDDKEQLKQNHNFDDAKLEDETIKNYRPIYYKNGDYQLLICHVIDQKTFEAHAVNVCVMDGVIITLHNGALEQFIDIERTIKDKNDDLEIDIALHILLNTIDQYFNIVHEIEDEVILFEERHAMNKIINVLTIISGIFLPLTLITGIYGMNFENMPELGWNFGYFMTLGVMLLISVTMLVFFKRKGWM